MPNKDLIIRQDLLKSKYDEDFQFIFPVPAFKTQNLFTLVL